MKSSRKVIFVFLSIFLILSIIVGCGANKVITSEDTAVENSSSAPQEAAEMEEAGFGSDSSSPLEPEKVITTIDMRFETTDFDKSIEDLENIIGKNEGYVEYSDIHYNSRNNRNGNYTIRIPKNNIQEFKSDLSTIGNKTSESVNKQDVTKQYTDTESRLKVLEVKEERILTLMEKAEKIEDIIKLEEQLSQVIYEKEQLQANLIDLDDKIDFSTINLYIREVDKFSSSNTPETTFGQKISDAIGDSIYFFRNTLEDLIILLIYVLPFIVILGVIAYAVYRFIIKPRKNKM